MSKLTSREAVRVEIKTLSRLGFSPPSIASQLSINIKTVYKWINSDQIEDAARSGRKTKLTPETRKMIEEDFDAINNVDVMVDPELAVLMQDGAPGHSAATTIDLIESVMGDDYWGQDFWPGGSPDLNPIEHIWSILQESIHINPLLPCEFLW